MAVGVENLNIISDEAYEQVQETMKANSAKVIKGEGKKSMTVQEYQFEAQMRSLDAQVPPFFLMDFYEFHPSDSDFTLSKSANEILISPHHNALDRKLSLMMT